MYNLTSCNLVNSVGVFRFLLQQFRTNPDNAVLVLTEGWPGIKQEHAKGILSGNGWSHTFGEDANGGVVKITRDAG